jgi:hypothetical protein
MCRRECRAAAQRQPGNPTGSKRPIYGLRSKSQFGELGRTTLPSIAAWSALQPGVPATAGRLRTSGTLIAGFILFLLNHVRAFSTRVAESWATPGGQIMPGDLPHFRKIHLAHPDQRHVHLLRGSAVALLIDGQDEVRHDLPRYAKAIRDLSTGQFPAIGSEGFPQGVDLRLRLARHVERIALVELAERVAAVECEEFQAR